MADVSPESVKGGGGDVMRPMYLAVGAGGGGQLPDLALPDTAS